MVAAIIRLLEIAIFANRYGTLFNDRVRFPKENEGNYLRWKWSENGVMMVPCREGRYGICEMYRYPVGGNSWEFPGGGIHPGETAEKAAARELLHESGCVAREFVSLGRIFPDPGLIENPLAILLAMVEGQNPATPDDVESISAIQWLTAEELEDRIRTGQVADARSISAWMLAKFWLRLN